MKRLPDNDIAQVLVTARHDLLALAGKRIFITGGSGFIGSWLVESLCAASKNLDLRLRLDVLTRDAEAFCRRLPHLANESAIRVIQGDVRSLASDGQRYEVMIHAATDASAKLNREDPLLMADTIVEGTRRALEFAHASGAHRFLMLSSGGIYGKFMPNVTHVSEGYPGGPDPLDVWFTYSESKRMAELLCAIYASKVGLQIPIARIFALVGPRLPLDIHFAAGNFIRDALQGGPIRISGDGSACRSYLYAADLVVWLLAVLVRGQSARAYNVGSPEVVSIKELAEVISEVSPGKPTIEIAGHADASNPVSYYVPDVARACTELNVTVATSLKEAISRTMAWYEKDN